MAHDSTAEKKLVGLPLLVASPVDVGRLIRELEAVDEQIQTASIKGQQIELTHLSRLMQQAIEMNHLSIADENDRKQLMVLLTTVRAKAPILHISFSADPTPVFTEKLMAWLRREIHPLVLITIGLQPNLGAGCIVRSTNKYFDLSLKQEFQKKKSLLMERLITTEQPA